MTSTFFLCIRPSNPDIVHACLDAILYRSVHSPGYQALSQGTGRSSPSTSTDSPTLQFYTTHYFIDINFCINMTDLMFGNLNRQPTGFGK